MWQAVQSQLKTSKIIALAVLGTGFFLSLVLAKHQLAPIEALTEAATSVEARKFEPTALAAVTARHDELGRLARVFSNMGQTVLAREEKLDALVQERTKALAARTEQLETLSTKLSKYLAPQVYASIFQGRQQVEIASNRKKLTVFFSDIVGFTETTENLDSQELTSILNRYLNQMAGIALKYGATLDKYVGDAKIAFFGDPETRGIAEDAKACIAMALEMQQRIAELDSQWQADGFERRFRVRMGINTGFCTVGNFGSQDRMDYTIIGATVNLAARLQSAADPGKILMARETWLLVKDVVIAKELPPLTVKGIATPVPVYELLGLKSARSTRVIRRNTNGLQITIELERSDREETVQVLKELISEIDVERHAV